MENFILCKNTCWVLLMSYCSLISWELTDLRMRGENNCLRTTKVIITFPSVSRKLSWATAKQKTPRNQSKFSFHRMSPKISRWNWILWKALGLHKTKAAAVVMIKLIEWARAPNFCPRAFCCIPPPWPILGLPPKVGCHRENIIFIQAINYLTPTRSLAPSLFHIAGKIISLAHCFDHIDLLHDHFHWISPLIYNVTIKHLWYFKYV